MSQSTQKPQVQAQTKPAEKFCVTCHHARAKHEPDPGKWICASPKNIISNTKNRVTGEDLPISKYAWDLRYGAVWACGEAGKWHQTTAELYPLHFAGRDALGNKSLKNVSLEDL